MQPVPGGRHCFACQRTVTDFSGFSDEELQQYFLSYKGGDLCGRFRTAQLERVSIQIPFYVVKKRQPVLRKFLLLLLLCFGSTLFQADVELNGSSLYAQTAITGHKQQKKTKKKSKPKQKKETARRDISDIHILGFVVIKHIPRISLNEAEWKEMCEKEPLVKEDKPTAAALPPAVKANIRGQPDREPRKQKKKRKPVEYAILAATGKFRRRRR